MKPTAQSSGIGEREWKGEVEGLGEAVHLFSLEYLTQHIQRIGVITIMKMPWTSSQSLKGSTLLSPRIKDVNSLLIKQKRNTFCIYCTQRDTERSMFIFGLGYTGLAAANYFRQKGFKVAGTCTSPEKQHILKLRGFTDTFLFDPDNDLFLNNRNQDSSSPSSSPALSALLSSSYILSTIPPSLSAIPFPPDDNIMTNINNNKATTSTTSTPTPTTASTSTSTSTSILANIDPVLAVHTFDISSHQNLHWLGYISSTSVYGDYGGDWVDESSPLKCISQKGIARAYAEKAWLNVLPLGGGRNECSVNIFRCGGIYGPSRSALDIVKRQQQEQEQVEVEKKMVVVARNKQYSADANKSRSEKKRSRQRYTSRVHVLDICRCIESNIAKKQETPRSSSSASIYNVVDDDPSPRREVVAFARHLLLGTELSENNDGSDDTDTDTQRGEWKGLIEEKRVTNRLMKEELWMKLEFPTYRQGLTALAAGDTRPY